MYTDRSQVGDDSQLQRLTHGQVDEILELAQGALDQQNLRVAQALLRRALKLDIHHVQTWKLAYAHFALPGETIAGLIQRWRQAYLHRTTQCALFDMPGMSRPGHSAPRQHLSDVAGSLHRLQAGIHPNGHPAHRMP